MITKCEQYEQYGAIQYGWSNFLLYFYAFGPTAELPVPFEIQEMGIASTLKGRLIRGGTIVRQDMI